jgi:hypothetical protein
VGTVQSAKTGSGSAEVVGNGERIVNQGECMFSIANETGHFWKTLWNHPKNAELKQKRGSPHVLLAGDQVHIPPIELREESKGTEKRHLFQLKGTPINFEIKVCEDDEPRSGEPYQLTIEGRTKTGKIPDDGVIRTKMYPSDRQGELIVGSGEKEQHYTINFGHLDPAHSRSGAMGRLRNLGYLSMDDDDDNEYTMALKKFQQSNGLNPSGELDSETAQKLAEKHGS